MRTRVFVLILVLIPFVSSHVFSQDSDTVQARQFLDKSRFYFESQQLDSAIYFAEKGDQIYAASSDWAGKVRARSYIGLFDIISQKDIQRGKKRLLESIKMGEENLESNHIFLGKSYSYMYAYSAISKRSWKATLDYQKKALPIFKEYFGPYSPECLNLLYQIAAVSERANLLEEGLPHLEFLVNAHKDSLVNLNRDLLNIYSQLGETYYQFGDYQAAKGIFEDLFLLVEQLEGMSAYEKGEYNRFVTNVKLGRLYTDTGDYDQALNYLKNTSPGSGRYYLNIGNVYILKKDFKLAKRILYSGIEVAQKAENQQAYLPDLYMTLAELYTELEIYDSAMLLIEKGRAYTKDYISVGREITLIAFEQIHGNLLAFQGKHKDALSHYQDALKKAENSTEFYPNKHTIYQALGDQFFEMDKFDESLQAYQMSLYLLDSLHTTKNPLAPVEMDSINIRMGHALSFRSKGDVFYKKYEYLQDSSHLRSALNHYFLAIQAIERIRETYLEFGSKEHLAEYARLAYEGVVKSSLEFAKITGDKRHKVQALAFAEKSKSLNLYEQIRANEAIRYANIPDSLIEKENRLKREISYFMRNLPVRSEKEFKFDGDNLEDVYYWRKVRKLTALKWEYQQLIQKLEEEYPDYHSLKYKRESIELAYIQSQLTGSKKMIIQYFLGHKQIYIFGITSDNLIVHTFERDKVFNQQLDQYLTNLHSSTAQASAEEQLSYTLYQKILHPLIEKVPFSIKSLILIPDSKLGYLPFESLLTEPQSLSTSQKVSYESLPFLLQQHEIQYAHSLSILFHSDASSRRLFKPRQKLAAFAPSYSGSQSLAFNEAEVNNINRFMKGDVFKGIHATESIFKRQAPNYAILHLAMHGKADPLSPLHSSLEFTSLEQDSVEDNRLHNFELYNLRLRANLAVLSACESGYGPLAEGEGIKSIARAFRYAGCPNIIMSLWNAESAVSQKLMTSFYKHLSEGATRSQALRLAKLEYLANPLPGRSHPRYWANFVLIGDAGELGSSSKWWWIVFTGILILSVGIWVLKGRQRAH